MLSIDECPEQLIGDGRLVTGTFHHSAANVIELTFSHSDESIRSTDNQPFWSEDRQEFVQAGQLNPGEQVRLRDGSTSRLISTVPVEAELAVFNLEVDGEHVYYVGRGGVLVHNAGGRYNRKATPPRLSNRWRARNITDPACQTGCEAAARQIQKHFGGDIKRIVPKGDAPGLGGYRGHQPGWSHHEVVVSNGRVYDAFTGHKGLPIAEWKQLWQFPEAINFGF